MYGIKTTGTRSRRDMSTIERRYLINVNRVLVFALTLTALLMDGYQRADLPATLALLVWLWLAPFTRIEAKILSQARRHRLKVRSRDRRRLRTDDRYRQPHSESCLQITSTM